MTQQLPSHEIEQAWSRIGRSNWHKMAWFVKLANVDWDTLSPGDLHNWQDEFRAIREDASPGITSLPPQHSPRYWKPKGYTPPVYQPPSLEDMKEVQRETAPHLNDIANDQNTHTHTLNIDYMVSFIRTSHEEEHAGAPQYQVMRSELPFNVTTNLYSSPLYWKMIRLLEEFADFIRRCPHCKQIFLQVKRNARYCSRSCHSVAGMRLKRAEERKRTTRRTTKLRGTAKAKFPSMKRGQR